VGVYLLWAKEWHLDFDFFIKYFFVQVFSSLIIFGRLLFIKIDFIMSVLFLKLGVFPFYFWRFSIVQFIRKKIISFIFGAHKFFVLWLLVVIIRRVFWVIIINVLGGIWFGVGQLRVKGILFCSSFIHFGWMLTGGGINIKFFFTLLLFLYYYFYLING